MTANVIDIAPKLKATRGNQPRRKDAKPSAADERLRLTRGRDNLLAELDPPMKAEWLTTAEAAAYLGVPRATFKTNTHLHPAEIRAVGYEAPTVAGKHGVARYSRRAIMHVALIMRPGTSAQADRIKHAIGVLPLPSPCEPTGHETMARGLLRRAKEIAQEVQEEDPQTVWSALVEECDRYRLQALVIALAALLPLDQSGLQHYLVQLGLDDLRSRDLPAHPSRAAAVGLAALIPERTDWESDK